MSRAIHITKFQESVWSSTLQCNAEQVGDVHLESRSER